jgi:uncharacterized protein YbjT (DUF2867 family)
MRNVLIIGASGGIAQIVTDLLIEEHGIQLTLFVRNMSRLKVNQITYCKVVEGNAMDVEALKSAMAGQDIVYVNLAGDLEKMAKNIVAAMKQTGVGKVIFISSIGIYQKPLKSVLIPYRKGADVIEESGLDYTILRPNWFSNADEVDYETTKKGEPEKGSTISRKSLATLITEIIKSPDDFKNQNLSVNKPNS